MDAVFAESGTLAEHPIIEASEVQRASAALVHLRFEFVDAWTVDGERDEDVRGCERH